MSEASKPQTRNASGPSGGDGDAPALWQKRVPLYAGGAAVMRESVTRVEQSRSAEEPGVTFEPTEVPGARSTLRAHRARERREKTKHSAAGVAL